MALHKLLSRFQPPWRAMLALLVGALSGVLAQAVGLPLPWMLGPMIGTTIAALSGAPIRSPARLRVVFLPVLGVMLGSGIDASILLALGRWSITFAFLIPFSIAAAAASYWFYRGIGRYDPVTAFFSAMPGGLNDMVIMGVEAGGEEKRIAMAHATRILAVILFGVLFFGVAMGVSSGSAAPRGAALDALTVQDWLVLGGCALLGVPFASFLRLPAPAILGPMVLSGIAHVTGLVTVAPPDLVVIIAQVVIGTVIGGRFVGASLRQVGRDMGLGVGSSLLMIAVAVLFALIVSTITGTEISHTFLAYSPGGLTEMSLLALAMGQEVAYVSVMHVARLTLVIFAAAPALRWLRRARRVTP
ncbi:AbrB family transcriptional regulator [Devosia sp. A369]